MHIYRSVNREMFEQYLMQVSAYFIRSYVDAAFGRVEISAEDRQTIIDYYKCVGFGLVLDWLNSGMNEDRAKGAAIDVLQGTSFHKQIGGSPKKIHALQKAQEQRRIAQWRE